MHGAIPYRLLLAREMPANFLQGMAPASKTPMDSLSPARHTDLK